MSLSEEKRLPSLGLDSSGALVGLDEPLEAAFARLFRDMHDESIADNKYFVAYIEMLACYFARVRLWRR